MNNSLMKAAVRKIMHQRKVINKIAVVNALVNYKISKNNSNILLILKIKNQDIVENKVLVSPNFLYKIKNLNKSIILDKDNNRY